MPNIFVEMIEGKTVEQKQALAKEFTDAAVRILNVDPEVVNIRFMENKKENLARGGKLFLYR
ncbi:tautomerase family protein [Bacilliculturomica massiliensis]|uniref:tautomerase family protein n=1 Tax=Bacilliculturomica massiliensis TaxID=1917867 RepID=UPI00102FB8ED|nr:tautomerase family protein [Bacilliculturomica massiliensis]